MFVLAVTGNIGAGKTEAVELFRSKGAIVLDLDRMAKRALEPGHPARDALVKAFGPEIVGTDDRIDAGRLADVAFASDEATARLEAIVHPYVIEDVVRTLADLAVDRDGPPVVVMEVPLLVRTPELREIADLVLAVSAPPPERLERARTRGMSERDARARQARQAPDEEVLAIADRVIENAEGREGFRHSLERFWDDEVLPRVT